MFGLFAAKKPEPKREPSLREKLSTEIEMLLNFAKYGRDKLIPQLIMNIDDEHDRENLNALRFVIADTINEIERGQKCFTPEDCL